MGDPAGASTFQSSYSCYTGKHVTSGILGGCGPNCLEIIKLLACSLGWFVTFLIIILTPWGKGLHWIARLRAADSHFILFSFTKNHTNSHHLTKLLDDGLLVYPSLLLLYSLVPKSFGLTHDGGRGWKIFMLWIGVIYTHNELRSVLSLFNWLINWLTVIYVPRGHTTNWWEPVFWLGCWGSNTISLSGMKINFYIMCFGSRFLVDILSHH